MDRIVIEGGVRLKGDVQISGAKNSALPIFAATILAPGVHTITNVPDLRDIRTIAQIVSALGADVERTCENEYTIDTENIDSCSAPYELVKTMRASCLVLGPLLARFGSARVSLPGGCAIGERPIDQHLKGFEALGAKIELSHGYVKANCGELTGARIIPDIVTVTGVMNIMMSAVHAQGVTTIENSAREPEISALADFLRLCGAKITGDGTSVIKIEGVKTLTAPEKPYAIIPDRIEAGTYLACAAMTGGEVSVSPIDPEYLAVVLEKFKSMGCEVTESGDKIKLAAPEQLSPVDITTEPFPGFPTDMQAQFMSLLSLAKGASLVKETIFENRFMHVAELRRMGANINVNGNVAMVTGVEKLSAANVMATDLRASASLVVAGLTACGETVIDRVYHLDRGYEKMEEKLVRLGAKIKRI